MQWQVQSVDQIGAERWSQWWDLLDDSPEFESPYFTPTYVQCVARVLPNIEVAFLVDGSRLNAVFAFERMNGNVAGPVGRTLADYQGVVCRPGTSIDPSAMLRAAGLVRWTFNHLFPVSQPLASQCWTVWASPQMDFSKGRQAFIDEVYDRSAHLKKTVRTGQNRMKKALGTLTTGSDQGESDLLQRTLQWKSDQYESQHRKHPFREPWVRELLKHWMQETDDRFRGEIVYLKAGGEPVALHYCLRSRHVSHFLINTYDFDCSRYSPGLVSMLMAAEAGAYGDVQRVDFGKGLESYKGRLATTETKVGEGCVDLNHTRYALNQTLQRSRYRFLRSHWADPVRTLARRAADRVPAVRTLLHMR
ncbi:GNAT family N-acetyltransferase [Novipirellula caenicola]|uniref:BioF2-like acetyltransferase domain-containing protein n=1 Tax=Novipirellula caenicola TaxID=1536901 RepID=A0ABP9VYX6_9BACT